MQSGQIGHSAKCQACGDFGYRLPVAVADKYPKEIPAGALFREGIPCTECGHGVEFKGMQAGWLKTELVHLFPHMGYSLELEKGEPSGIPSQRMACSCGWKDAWFRRPS